MDLRYRFAGPSTGLPTPLRYTDHALSFGVFRRERAPRACEVCHSRKVRCDVTTQIPCTNCVAFGCECRIPSKRARSLRKGRRRAQHRRAPEHLAPTPMHVHPLDPEPISMAASPAPPAPTAPTRSTGPPANCFPLNASTVVNTDKEANAWSRLFTDVSTGVRHRTSNKVVYFGATGMLGMLADAATDDGSIFHFPLPHDDEVLGGNTLNASISRRLSELDPLDLEILCRFGSFALPPREICDTLVGNYFDRVHPIIPMLNKTQFLAQYSDPDDAPSLLLLQAVLMAGTRVSKIPHLLDENGSMDSATLILYKRAKHLHDVGYETDRIVIVQAMLLMSWCWQAPDDETRNVFYWTKIAISVGQGFGLHRSVEQSHLSVVERRSWKRLWWVLYNRDRITSLSLGRPVLINMADSDVPRLTEEDFIEEEGLGPYKYPPESTHVRYFIQSIALADITSVIIEDQFSVAVEKEQRESCNFDITRPAMALQAWFANLPKELRYDYDDPGKHDFLKSIMLVKYHCLVCLLHRADLSSAAAVARSAAVNFLVIHPSRATAFESAHRVVQIVRNMQLAGQLPYMPAFVIYTVFTAMIVLLYEVKLRTSDEILKSRQVQLKICVGALREMARTWKVALFTLRLFYSV
ncbi:fungal-specific transcription factor domain-containing protein, partial [Limtongia smithiae]|uniref:fungal-specific transcription factor domain-containing protein n=1 Tax=Limtongia smithiae TaxID=1125753 RepID=UPI0034CD70B9